MTPTELLTTLTQVGVTLTPDGDMLQYRAPVGVLTPELRQAMAEHKAALLGLLRALTADKLSGNPCPVCGASAWRETPDAGRWCLPCVAAGRDPVAAVKVHSAELDAELWVVADDLPRDQWPTDAPVYTQAEVKILTQVGSDTLAWVHATKELFGAMVVRGTAPAKWREG